MTKSRCQWLVVFDVDEFIYPKGLDSIPELVTALGQNDTGEMTFMTLTMTSHSLERCPNVSLPEGYVHRSNVTPELFSYKSISLLEALYGHHIHSGIFGKGHNRTRRVVVPSELAYIVHYNLPCWRDYYKSRYKFGRSGLVRDWDATGYQEEVMPPNWDQNVAWGYPMKDTAFRDFFLATVARPRPKPSLVTE